MKNIALAISEMIVSKSTLDPILSHLIASIQNCDRFNSLISFVVPMPYIKRVYYLWNDGDNAKRSAIIGEFI